jgi:hypothetical protein
MPAPVRVKRAFQQYRVGDVISPVGLWRDHLLAYGFCEKIPAAPPAEEIAPKPVAAPEPEPEPGPAQETATAPRVENAQRPGKQNKWRGR